MSRKENNKSETQRYNQLIVKEIRSMVANNPDKDFYEILYDLKILDCIDIYDYSSEQTYKTIVE